MRFAGTYPRKGATVRSLAQHYPTSATWTALCAVAGGLAALLQHGL